MKLRNNLYILFILTLLSIGMLTASISVVVKQEYTENKINIKLDNEDEPIKLVDFVINPGEEVTYKVYLDAKNQMTYDVSIWFESVDTSLNNILYAYARYDTYRTNSKSVTEITNDSKLNFNYSKSLQDRYFELVFYIPSEIGNETQKLDFSFKTFISVKGSTNYETKDK